MLVKVYADAGHRHTDGASAAGGRIVRGRKVLDVAGGLSRPYPSVQHAELAAIGAIICHGIRREMICRGDDVEVLADNKHALRYLAGNGPTRTVVTGTELDPAGGLNKRGEPRRRSVYEKLPKDPELAELAKMILEMLAAAGARLKRAKWVKGHNLKAGTDDAASNHRCDKLAKSALRRVGQSA